MKRSLLGATTLVLVMFGCGPQGDIALPELVPVQGKVTTPDGRPVGPVMVELILDPQVPQTGRSCGGKTNVDGTFTLSMGSKEGAPKGKHRVVISPIGSSPEAAKLIPPKLKDESKSTLVVDISGPTSDLNIVLQ